MAALATEELVSRLKALTPIINEIRNLSGCPGVSVGVLHHKKVIFKQGYGYRDVERKLAPDEHTIYYLASLSKSFTCALIAELVEQGKMDWSTPITQILPTAKHWDTTIREQANIVDWMSHRTGLAAKNAIWSQEFGDFAMRRRDAIPTTTYLEKIFDFRTRWLYSNWGYALADEVITKLSGMSWGTMLRQKIFDPLKMDRTITTHDSKLSNIAESYMAFASGKPHHLPRPFPEDGKVMEGAVAVQSNVHDLLNYYAAVMEAAEDQTKNGTTSTANNPVKHASMLTKKHIDLVPTPSKLERSYGLGWIRTELPNTLGVIGLNPRYVDGMPTCGKGLQKPVLCLYHQGSTNTFLSSVHTIPETHTAVVVLTNSLGNNDTADWLGELLLETVLDISKEQRNDYVQLAKQSAIRSNELWDEMRKELEDEKIPNTHPQSLEVYVGKYYNAVGTYHLEIATKDDSLFMCFQGNHDQWYELDHYHKDVFSWLLTRNQDVRRGRFPVTRADFYLLSFSVSKANGAIDSLSWVNDPAVPEGEVFEKQGASQPGEGIPENVVEGPV